MASVTSIDWCAFRTKAAPADVFEAVQFAFAEPHHVSFEATGKGWNGYDQCRRITVLQKPVGIVAFGGSAMRGWCQVNLTGDSMDHISGDTARTLSGAVQALEGQYKRVDIALTTSDGSVSLQTVRKAWETGGFSTGGRRPKLGEVRSSLITDGQTLYIGERDQPKFCRAYEKGYQLAKEFGLRAKAHGISDHLVSIDGSPVQDIFRVEVEFKPSPDLFPHDIMTNRDTYFSGAYPYLATLVQAKPETFQLTPQRKAQFAMDKVLAECRRQYGDALFTALMLHEGDITAVWDKVCGTKHSRSLLESGVLHAMDALH